MAQHDDLGWPPTVPARTAAAREGTWSLRPLTTPDRRRRGHLSVGSVSDWRQMDGLRLVLACCAVAVVLIAGGAGLAVALDGDGTSTNASNAGLYAVSPPGGALSAGLTRRIARAVDPAVVDVNAVIETASGAADVAGTGMIVSAAGEVITNNHVVENAKSIKVTMRGHRVYRAVFVGAEPAQDIAVLQLSGHGRFPTVRLARASVQVGEGVLAFGNALGLGGIASVTTGTVSALDRSITATSETGADAEHLSGMIETDAPIAPGSSGGPLVDSSGAVVGMNTAAASATGATGTPLAFAIPIGRVALAARAIEAGRRAAGIVLGRTAYLGIEGTTTRLAGPHPRGAVNIIQVEPATPAVSAGLQPGDVILSFGGVKVSSMPALARAIESRKPGAEVSLVYVAGGLRHHVEVRLVAGPAA